MFNEIKTHELTIDVVVLTIKNNKLQVLLTKRNREPFKGRWAIPGGFIRLSENLDDAALRILKEKTDVEDIYLEQLYTFGDPLRYPNARVITCAYYALVKAEDVEHIFENENPELVNWHDVYNLPEMAFDHKTIIEYSIQRTRARLEYFPISYKLLPEKFTLTELQRTYELILNKQLDKRNFRKKILTGEMLIETDEYTKSSSKRPAKLFMFEPDIVNSKKSLILM
ncbi:MAG: NUDIX hydrolase [Candidatus Gastranaerophilales bacterium]|nr:NUDIX hydrolase [Candidatus Gastranaerophilales bacterium]